MSKALDEPPISLEHRVVDMDEGQARDRARVDAGTGDVGERGRHHQVAVAVGNPPPEATHRRGGQLIGAGDDHGVGIDGIHRVERGAEAADDGDTRYGRGWTTAGDDPHDVVARTRSTPDRLDDMFSLRGLGEHERAVDILRALLLTSQPLPPHPSREDEQHSTRGQRDQQKRARHVQSEKEGEGDDDSEHGHTRVADAGILDAAVAEDVPLARIEDTEHQQPQHADHDQQGNVGDRRATWP